MYGRNYCYYYFYFDQIYKPFINLYQNYALGTKCKNYSNHESKSRIPKTKKIAMFYYSPYTTSIANLRESLSREVKMPKDRSCPI